MDKVTNSASFEGSVEQRPQFLKRAAIALIKAYQGASMGHLSPCRFYPSCSAYAIEAIEVYGTWKGIRLSARRLLRCRPFGSHGVDLVPLRDEELRGI